MNVRFSVHPRACGEHSWPAPTEAFADGSSPRLRGTQRARTCKANGLRFIPAPAGNT